MHNSPTRHPLVLRYQASSPAQVGQGKLRTPARTARGRPPDLPGSYIRRLRLHHHRSRPLRHASERHARVVQDDRLRDLPVPKTRRAAAGQGNRYRGLPSVPIQTRRVLQRHQTPWRDQGIFQSSSRTSQPYHSRSSRTNPLNLPLTDMRCWCVHSPSGLCANVTS